MFDPTKKCPFLKKPCIKHDCTLYLAIRGQHPQTGQDLDEWGCAIVWNVVGSLEGAKEMRQNAAATESFRNEMVELGQKQMMLAAKIHAIEGERVEELKRIANAGKLIDGTDDNT